jgi:hypothetical protein
MRTFYRMFLAILIGLSTVAISFAQERSPNDVRHEVEQLCQNGEVVSAFDMAMKSLIQARRKFGSDDPRTAECMVTVADAAKHREKHYLAGRLYRKALSIQEPACGPSHPDVVRCKLELSNLQKNHDERNQ